MKKRILAMLLALALAIGLLPTLPMTAFADDIIGTVDGVSYSTASAFVQAFSKKDGTHVVHLYTDLNLYSANINDRITIASSASVTIYLHGHMITRGLSASHKYGNVFLLDAGSTLNLIGYENTDITGSDVTPTAEELDRWLSNHTHTVACYNFNPQSPASTTTASIRGAVITGANTAVDGTIVNRKYYGGAFQLLGENTTLNLVNVTVAGNRTDFSGGAINIDGENNTITLHNSHLKYNYAKENGGAIEARDATMIEGDGISSVSNNYCVGKDESGGGGGGGIDIYKGSTTIKNLVISGNATGSLDGGGICVRGTAGSAIRGCTITGNTAVRNGGGVFIKHGDTSLADCTITGNTSASGLGNGVYLSGETNNAVLNLGGLMTIRDNGTNNLCLSDSDTYINPSMNNTSKIYMTVSGAPRRISPGQGTYSWVPFTYDNNADYGFMWYSDPTDASNADKYRELWVVAGKNQLQDPTAVEQPDKVVTDSEEYTVNGAAYSRIKTWFSYPSANDTLSDCDAVCFYSDGYFFENENLYNEHLATMSHALVMSGFYTNLGNEGTALFDSTAYASTRGTRYDNKHAHVRQLLANIGCEDESIYLNDFDLTQPGMDSIGVAIAHKELKTADGNGTGMILVPVVVRGSGYEAEWASNVSVGAGDQIDGEELGFAMASNMVYSDVLDYLKSHDLEGKAASGNLIFWVVGYSRAGATANLTAKRLIAGSSPDIDISSVNGEKTNTDFSRYLKNNDSDVLAGRALDIGTCKVISYTFEAAQGGTDAAQNATEKPESAFFCLHNVVNAADAVPFVGPAGMGFKRYGVDHYVPGTARTETAYPSGTAETVDGYQITKTHYTENAAHAAQSGISVTTYRDNDYLPVSTTAGDYTALRSAMLDHYQAVNPYMVFDDYFHTAEITIVSGAASSVFGGIPLIGSLFDGGEFNPELGDTSISVEQYIVDLVETLQAWMDIHSEDTSVNNALPNTTTRAWYATHRLRLNGTEYDVTFQQALRHLFKMLYSTSPADADAAVEDIKSILGGIGVFGSYINANDILYLYRTVLPNWYQMSASEKFNQLEKLWGIIVDTGALRHFDETEQQQLKADFPTVIDPLLTFLSKDYSAKTTDYSGSAYGASYHYNTAGSGDATHKTQRLGTLLYNYQRILMNHYAETVMAWLRASDSYYASETSFYKIAEPEPAVLALTATAVAQNGLETNVPAGAETSCCGDQVLHLDVDRLKGEAIYYSTNNGASWELYKNCIPLADTRGSDTASVKAYAISYGVKSAESTFTVKFSNAPQEQYVDDANAMFHYSEGDWTSEDGVHKITVSSTAPNTDLAKSVSFTFTGTGYRIHTDTSNHSGAVMITRTWTEDGTLKTFRKIVQLYRGFSGYDTEAASWTPVANTEEGYAASLYHEIPAICEEGLDAREYTVTVTPYYARFFDVASRGSYEFVLNGVTVLNPEGHEDTYQYTSFHDAAVNATSLISLDVLYLYYPDWWLEPGGAQRVYFYNDSTNAWADAFPTGEPNIYAVKKPAGSWTALNLARCDPSKSGWGAVWNQTTNVTIGENNYIRIMESGFSGSRWLDAESGQYEESGDLYIDVSQAGWGSAYNHIGVYFFGHDTEPVEWVTAVATGAPGIYKVNNPKGYPKLIVRKMLDASDVWGNNWEEYSYQTVDVTLDGYNLITVRSDFDSGSNKKNVNRGTYTASQKEAVTGGVMIDGTGTVTDIDQLKKNGPKNLLYLDAHNALIFTVGSSGELAASTCGVGAKGLNTLTNAKLAVYAMEDNSLTELLNTSIASYRDDTNSYYSLTGDADLAGKALIVYNPGTAPIALTRLRTESPVTLSFSEPTGWRGVRLLRRLQEGTLEPIETGPDADGWFAGNSLSLHGDIGVNFYVDLQGRSSENATVELRWSNGMLQTVALKDLTPETEGAAAGCYQVTANVSAKEMAEAVTATLYLDGERVAENAYSVADYANRILENKDGAFDGLRKLPELQALCRAMLRYGAAAQTQFNYSTALPADHLLADKAVAPLTGAELAALGANGGVDLSAYGVSFFGISLLLQTKTTYRLYFTIEDESKLAGLAAQCGGKLLERGTKDGLLYFNIADISAKNITDDFTVSFGTLENETFTQAASGTFNTGAYLRQALAGSDETLKSTVTALYRYGQAAKAYFQQSEGGN